MVYMVHKENVEMQYRRTFNGALQVKILMYIPINKSICLSFFKFHTQPNNLHLKVIQNRSMVFHEVTGQKKFTSVQ